MGETLEVALDEQRLRKIIVNRKFFSVAELMKVIEDLSDELKSGLIQMDNVLKDIAGRSIYKITKPYVDSRIGLINEAINTHLRQANTSREIFVKDPMMQIDQSYVENFKTTYFEMHINYLQKILSICKNATSILELDGHIINQNGDAKNQILKVNIEIDYKNLVDKTLDAIKELLDYVGSTMRNMTTIISSLNRILTEGSPL